VDIAADIRKVPGVKAFFVGDDSITSI